MDNSGERPTIADIPSGWTRTQRPAIQFKNLEWRSYQTGVATYAIVAEFIGLHVVCRNWQKSTYSATRDGQLIGRSYRDEKPAMAALAKSLATYLVD